MYLYLEESSTYLMPTLICECVDTPTELVRPTFVAKLEDKGNEEENGAKKIVWMSANRECSTNIMDDVI
jgi:hypothetical protein